MTALSVVSSRKPQLGDRVHWATGRGAGQSGRIVALQGIPERFGTMVVEWDCGPCSKNLPQRLLAGDPGWSYA